MRYIARIVATISHPPGRPGRLAELSRKLRGNVFFVGLSEFVLRVVAVDGSRATWPMLARRYAVGTVSLAAAGIGFWWAWADPDRLAWHDRLSGTRMVRDPRAR